MNSRADVCEHGHLRRQCEVCELKAVEKAARKLFTAKGRYHSQLAMCELGELLGYPVVWPKREARES